jgi:DNA-binding SARP family transcriptional activator
MESGASVTELVFADPCVELSVAIPALRVSAFGSLSILSPVGSFGPRDLGGLKAKQLFELLLLSRRTSLSKASLADDLWDTKFPQNVSATLENYVSILRHHLFESSVRARAVIVTEHDAYRLAPDFVDCDLDAFDRLVARASTATHAEEVMDFLDQAQHLATGDVFEDEPNSAWAVAWRDRYRRKVVDVRLSAAELAVRVGRYKVAEDHAEHVMDMEPLNERAVRVAMHVAVEMGCQHRALAIYERSRHSLAEELGILPSEQTRNLHSLVVRQQPLPPCDSHKVVSATDNFRDGLRVTGQTIEKQAGSKVFAPSPRITDSTVKHDPRVKHDRTVTDDPTVKHDPTLTDDPTLADDYTLILLFGACALAKQRGGPMGVFRLLSEASDFHDRLQQQRSNNGKGDLPLVFSDQGLNDFFDLISSSK